MKRLIFYILLATISIVLTSACAVSAADADNINLEDTGFGDTGFGDTGFKLEDSRFLLAYDDNGNYIQNIENTPLNVNKDADYKELEDLISKYNHSEYSLEDSSFRDTGFGDTGFKLEDSRFLLAYDDNGNYIQNIENTPLNVNKDADYKELEDLISKYSHQIPVFDLGV